MAGAPVRGLRPPISLIPPKGKKMKHLKIKHFLSAAVVAGAAAFGAPESARAAYYGKILFHSGGLCVHPEGRRNETKDNTRLILHSDACHGSDVRLGFHLDHLGNIKPGADTMIWHPYSGKCVHPRGGDNPKDGAELVLYGKGCGLWKTKFRILPNGMIQHAQSKKCVFAGGRSPKKHTRLRLYGGCSTDSVIIPAKFRFADHRKAQEYDVNARIFHRHSGLCMHPQGRRNDTGNDTRLILHSDYCEGLESRLAFVLQSNGSILHPFSGKCFHPKGGKVRAGNRTPVVLYDGCNHDKNKFRRLQSGAIQHVGSGRCIHPKGGRGKKGALLWLYNGCTGDQLKFDVHTAAPRHVHSRIITGGGRFIHGLSGSCIQPKGREWNPGNKHPLVFGYDGCGDDRDRRIEFEILPSGAIRHVLSGKCIHPKGGKDFPNKNTPLHLYDGCRARYVQFELRDGLLFHKLSGMCVHPKGGSTRPKNGAGLVLWPENCYGERYKFRYVPNRR